MNRGLSYNTEIGRLVCTIDTLYGIRGARNGRIDVISTSIHVRFQGTPLTDLD